MRITILSIKESRNYEDDPRKRAQIKYTILTTSSDTYHSWSPVIGNCSPGDTINVKLGRNPGFIVPCSRPEKVHIKTISFTASELKLADALKDAHHTGNRSQMVKAAVIEYGRLRGLVLS